MNFLGVILEGERKGELVRRPDDVGKPRPMVPWYCPPPWMESDLKLPERKRAPRPAKTIEQTLEAATLGLLNAAKRLQHERPSIDDRTHMIAGAEKAQRIAASIASALRTNGRTI